MAKHLNCPEQESRRVGNTLAGNHGRRAVNGFKHSAFFTNIGRTRKPYRTCNFCSDIRNDVAVKVERYDYFKILRGIGKFGCADIDDPVVVGDVRVFCSNFVKDFSEQTIGLLHDVVFGKTSYLIASVEFSVFKCIADDLLTTWAANEFEALHYFIGLLVFDACIEVFFVFTNDHQIHFRMLCRHIRMQTKARANVGIQAQKLARRHIQALVTPTLRRGYWRLQKYFIASDGIPSFRTNTGGIASQINLLTYLNFVVSQLGTCCFQNRKRCLHNFWPNAISFCDRNTCHHVNF